MVKISVALVLSLFFAMISSARAISAAGSRELLKISSDNEDCVTCATCTWESKLANLLSLEGVKSKPFNKKSCLKSCNRSKNSKKKQSCRKNCIKREKKLERDAKKAERSCQRSCRKCRNTPAPTPCPTTDLPTESDSPTTEDPTEVDTICDYPGACEPEPEAEWEY